MERFPEILFISSEFPPGPGGIGNHGFNLCQALSRLGANVQVVTDTNFVSPQEASLFDRNLSFPVRRIYRRNSILLTCLHRTWETFRQMRDLSVPAVCICSGPFPLWLGGFMSVLFPHVRFLAVGHGSELRSRSMYRGMLTTWALKRFDAIVAVSHYTAQFFRPSGRQRLEIIPNAIDPVELDHLESELEGKGKLKGQPSILTVGKMSPRKGQHLVIAALPKLREFFPEVHYHIVGMPSVQVNLEKLAEKLGVRDAITFHGQLPRQELIEVYKGSDIFAMLSENQPDGDFEGFGIGVLEANYFHCPAIGSRGCGIEDAIDHQETGYLVEPQNPDAVAEGIKWLVENHNRASRAARTWASQHLWPEIGKRYMNVVNDLFKETEPMKAHGFSNKPSTGY